jgi:hypothetical protein
VWCARRGVTQWTAMCCLTALPRRQTASFECSCASPSPMPPSSRMLHEITPGFTGLVGLFSVHARLNTEDWCPEVFSPEACLCWWTRTESHVDCRRRVLLLCQEVWALQMSNKEGWQEMVDVHDRADRGVATATPAHSVVLPIFVLSLDGMPEGLSFLDGSLMHTSPHAALVLQVLVPASACLQALSMQCG